MANAERRIHPRIAVQMPAKLQCAVTGRYLTSTTCNLSRGGALLDVDHPSALVHGQRVRLGFALDARSPLLRRDDLVDATVVRSKGSGQQHTVAVCFDELLAGQQLPDWPIESIHAA